MKQRRYVVSRVGRRRGAGEQAAEAANRISSEGYIVDTERWRNRLWFGALRPGGFAHAYLASSRPSRALCGGETPPISAKRRNGAMSGSIHELGRYYKIERRRMRSPAPAAGEEAVNALF